MASENEVVKVNDEKENNKKKYQTNAWLALACGLLPFLGLILFLVWRNEDSEKAKAYGKISLIGFIFYAVIGAIVGLFALLIFLFGNGVYTAIYIILAVFFLLLMVTVHELGHYTAGRLLGFKINEFAVGFGKVLFQRKNKRGEKISLRLFPLGGFCAFEDEDADNKENPDAFNNQKPWKRIIVQASGAIFNILFAIIFSFIFLLGFGFDKMQLAEFTSTANQGKLITGDVVYGVKWDELKADNSIVSHNENIYFANDNTLQNLINRSVRDTKAIAGDSATEINITFIIKRDGKMQDATITFVKTTVTDEVTQEEKTYWDAGIKFKNYPQPFFEALGNLFPFVFGWIWVILKTFWMLITFRLALTSLSGPISTIVEMATFSSQGIANVFYLLPLISLNLAVFNLLPFPALDGARIAFTGVEWIRKKPINQNVQAYIHFGGLVFLLAFVVVIEIVKFISSV